MKFKELLINNFLAIGEAKIDLEDRGLVLIEGKNDDESSANSNGAGKSSIVDAICWCLYGTTARGVSGDDVVNKKIAKNCSVSLKILDGDKRYLITRTRKYEKVNNGLFVSEIDENGDEINEGVLTKGTMAETQKEVEKLVGCSYDVFVSSIYSAQEKMPDLPNLTDKYLKLLIEEAAGITKLQKAYETAKTKYDGLLSEIQTKEMQRARLLGDLNGFYDYKKELEDKKLEQVKKNELAIKNYKEQIAETETHLNDLKKRLDSEETLSEHEYLFKDKQSVISGFNGLQKKAKEKEKSANELKNSYLTQVKILEKDADEIKKIKKEIENIDKKVGTKCSECGKVYSEEDLEEAKQALIEKCSSLSTKLLKKKNELTKKKAEVAKALAEAKEENDNLPNIEDVYEDITELNKYFKEQADLRNLIDREFIKKVGLEKSLEELSKDKNAFEWMIKKTEKDIEDCSKEISKVEDEYLVLKSRVDVAEAVKQLYSVSGVRAFILDTITPFLNARTAEYLNILSDGTISAVWQTLTTTTKGDVKEKFNIVVTSKNGAKCFAGLSGGEKRKVRVATSLALQDLVASRATKPIDLYIADEVDHALDANGLERLMTILEQKGKNFGTALVISHNSLRDWIDNIITVQKKNGLSEVVDER